MLSTLFLGGRRDDTADYAAAFMIA